MFCLFGICDKKWILLEFPDSTTHQRKQNIEWNFSVFAFLLKIKNENEKLVEFSF